MSPDPRFGVSSELMVRSRSSSMWQPLVLLVACLAAADGANRVQAAEAPLHQVIDRLVESRAGKQPLAPMSGDAEFLRRVMLDLAGRIPTVAEARRFLGETAADKRFTLIDSLLSGDDYPRRMQELFHVMLMERRANMPSGRSSCGTPSTRTCPGIEWPGRCSRRTLPTRISAVPPIFSRRG